MARVTSQKAQEICGRFELILIATARAREIGNGSPPLTDNPGATGIVTALREIEEGKIDPQTYLAKYRR